MDRPDHIFGTILDVYAEAGSTRTNDFIDNSRPCDHIRKLCGSSHITPKFVTVLLIILCIIVGIWVYRRRLQIKLFFKDALKGAKLAKLRAQLPDKVIEQELVEIKSVAPDSEETGV